jgi:hypothetical protein
MRISNTILVRYALNEYEIEFMFRKIRNIRNQLGNVYIRGPHIVMSRTDAQNGLDFHFKVLVFLFYG